MKANSKRKVFGDAVDLLMGDMEEVTMPRGVQMLPVKSIQPFHDHPFHLYEGERLDDSIENEIDWLQMARFHAEWSKKFYDVIVPYLLK